MCSRFREAPDFVTPRLPLDRQEAGWIYQRWDSLNGRYYFTADLKLEDGELLRDVVSDGDTGIAVRYGGRSLCEQPELFGRTVAAWIVTRDRSCGGRFPIASAEEQAAFRAGGIKD